MLATIVTETTKTIRSLESNLREQHHNLFVFLEPSLQKYFTQQIITAVDSEERRDYAALKISSQFKVEDDGIIFFTQRLGQQLQHKVLFSTLDF